MIVPLQTNVYYEKIKGMRKLIVFVSLFLSIAVLFFALYQLPYFGDFDSVYYPMLFLDNPYNHVGFLNPPWLIAFLFPLKLLDQHTAGALWMLCSIMLVIYCIKKLDGDWLSYFLIFTNPSFIRFMTSGQIDALVLLGFVSQNPAFSVLLLTIKPQVIGMSVFSKLRQITIRQSIIISGVVLATSVIFNNWIAMLWYNLHNGLNHSVSMDMFPYGIPVGIALMIWATKNDKPNFAALSSYFFVPYVSPSSIFIYSVLIFSTFGIVPRLIFYSLLWIVALVLT